MVRFILPLLPFIVSCSQIEPEPEDIDNTLLIPTFSEVQCNPSSGWSIETTYISGGAAGKDGIPAIDHPNFSSVADIDFLTPIELVTIQLINKKVYIFPHRIMDKHEIVNLESDYSLTFCPLTGTSLAFEITDNTLGVTGNLHNSNLIMFDRKSETYWSQMLGLGIKGTNSCDFLSQKHSIETTWSTASIIFPNSLVLNLETGFDRNYTPPISLNQPLNVPPLFPIRHLDNALPFYQRVLAIPNGINVSISSFESFESTAVLESRLGEKDIIIVGNKELNYLTSFYKESQSGNLLVGEVQAIANGLFIDENGNQFDLLGRIVNGPLQGDELKSTLSYMSYWFAASSVYSKIFFIDKNSI